MVWSDSVKRSYRDSTWSPLRDSLRSYSPLRETPREYFDCLEETDCQECWTSTIKTLTYTKKVIYN